MSIECFDGTFLDDVSIGDSINVSGICSTVVKLSGRTFEVQYLNETLNKTTMGQATLGDNVNLEKCLTLSSKLGGHLVSGHVDCRGGVQSLIHDGEWAVLTVDFPKEFGRFVIPKGSIAIDGISLTVVDPLSNQLSCHLIPHTIKQTNLHTKLNGDSVNLEFDQVGKYLYSFYSNEKS